jgi:uncharacterized protein (DUF2384 family)
MRTAFTRISDMTGQRHAVQAEASPVASLIEAVEPVVVFDIEATVQEISISTRTKVRRSACAERFRQDELSRLEVSV